VLPPLIVCTALKPGSTLEATQGQIDGFFSQLPSESGGICRRLLNICLWVAFRVDSAGQVASGQQPPVSRDTVHPGVELRTNPKSISPQMLPLRGSICMGVDQRNHIFAPGLPPERLTLSVPALAGFSRSATAAFSFGSGGTPRGVLYPDEASLTTGDGTRFPGAILPLRTHRQRGAARGNPALLASSHAARSSMMHRTRMKA